MKQVLNSHMLGLDPHTAQLFDPDYEVAPIQAFVSIGIDVEDEPLFAGRFAPLKAQWNFPTSTDDVHPALRTWVPVFREVDSQNQILQGPGRACLISTDGLETELDQELSTEQIAEFWDTFYTQCQQIARCHVAHDSGIGVRVIWWGDCQILNFSVAERDPRATYSTISTGVKWMGATDFDDLDRDGLRAMAELSDAQFHGAVEAMIGDPSHQLCQAVRFYAKDENARCLDALGCGQATRQEMEELFALILKSEMAEGEPLGHFWRVEWFPWTNSWLKASMQGHPPKKIRMPASMSQRRAQAFRRWDCHAVSSPRRTSRDQRKAAEVRMQWALQCSCQCHPVSGHEAAIASSLCDERLKGYSNE